MRSVLIFVYGYGAYMAASQVFMSNTRSSGTLALLQISQQLPGPMIAALDRYEGILKIKKVELIIDFTVNI